MRRFWSGVLPVKAQLDGRMAYGDMTLEQLAWAYSAKSLSSVLIHRGKRVFRGRQGMHYRLYVHSASRVGAYYISALESSYRDLIVHDAPRHSWIIHEDVPFSGLLSHARSLSGVFADMPDARTGEHSKEPVLHVYTTADAGATPGVPFASLHEAPVPVDADFLFRESGALGMNLVGRTYANLVLLDRVGASQASGYVAVSEVRQTRHRALCVIGAYGGGHQSFIYLPVAEPLRGLLFRAQGRPRPLFERSFSVLEATAT